METNRIRQFCVVHETKNLRKAGEIIGLSHSALSKSLKVLQEETRIQLLIQNGRNIEITEEGRKFFLKAQNLLKAEQDLIKKSEPTQQPFKIGTFEVFSTHFLGQVWPLAFPEHDLELRELIPHDLEKAVIERRVHVGLTYEPIPTAGLNFLCIGKTMMKVYTRENSFPRTPTADLPFVAPVSPISGTPSGVKGLDGWPDHLFHRHVKYRVDMMESALALARSGAAAIFLPEFVMTLHNRTVKEPFRLCERPFPKKMKPVERKIYLILKQSASEDHMIRKLATLIRKECLRK